MHMSSPRVSTTAASSVTVRRRSSELRAARKIVSGGDDGAQLRSELSSNKIDRQEILNNLESFPGNFQIKIPADQVVAMKADLGLSWNKLRLMIK